MNYSDKKNIEEGMTIVELLLVLTIVIIVSTFALMQIDTSKKSLKMQNISTEFKTHLERSRFDAVKRRALGSDELAKVIIKTPRLFSVNTDLDQNGVLEIHETREVDFSYQDDIQFYDENLTFPVIISFNSRGHVTAIDGLGNPINSIFMICTKRCEEISTKPETFQIVSVTPTGTVTKINGDEVFDIATAPENISTDTSSGINPLVSTIPNDASILDFLKTILKK